MAETNLTRAAAERIARAANAAHARLSSIKDKAEEHAAHAIQTVEVAGIATAAGYARGRYGVTKILNVPVEGLAAAALHVTGYWGAFGKYREHAHNLGDGLLAVVGSVWGAQKGQEAAQAASAPPPTSGYEPAAFPGGQQAWGWQTAQQTVAPGG